MEGYFIYFLYNFAAINIFNNMASNDVHGIFFLGQQEYIYNVESEIDKKINI